MPDSTKIQCPRCHASLELDDDYYRELQGSSLECPQCQASIAIRSPKSRPVRIEVSTPPVARTCPNCSVAVDGEATICVKCGFNLVTGRRLKIATANRPRASTGNSIDQMIARVQFHNDTMDSDRNAIDGLIKELQESSN